MVQDSNILGLLEAGIRAEGLRQQAIANNIANMHTQGYRRSDVNFEEALNKAMGGQATLEPESLEFELHQTLNTPVNENGSDVNLDNEVGEMVKNSIRHRAYILLMKKRYQQMHEAMRTG
ncbi:MAG: flagellar basal body rod protein FlgB [Phycisphaerae bacterium]|nr:flagellar basal body rod protein FlgB [Phycisphaerae bacterium]